MNSNLRSLIVGGCLLFSVATVSAAEDVRLSQTLIPTEYVEAGLQRLTSDQLAILDALVRRDIAASTRSTMAKEARPARFSERLSADEQKNAGLSLLTPEQLARLDEYTARLTEPAGSFSSAFQGSRSGGPTRVTASSLRRAPEIHGSISLMYGMGSGGYSERGGSMVLSYEDPSGLALIVGYSEVHSKGGYGYLSRDYRDRYYGLGLPLW